MNRLPHTLLAAAALGANALAAQPPAPASLQAVVVQTDGWEATTARVQLWQRADPAAPWRAASPVLQAVVGRGGLGWGRGLHADGGAGPLKREGDGRAPAGVFRLAFAFGYAAEAPWIRIPYRHASAVSRCVDDGASARYNQWVEADSTVVPDWNSHEVMRRADELYRWGIWVEHNGDPARPGAGSCIFMHHWGGPAVPTVGCTAFAPADLETILRWLDPDAQPVLVQLPAGVYAGLRAPWGLP